MHDRIDDICEVEVNMNPFDFVNSINFTKKDLMVTPADEKSYNAFIINRSLSYFQDTILLANEMNKHHHIDSKMQYDFLINIVRKKKRFSKWDKASLPIDIEAVKEYYGFSNTKARIALSVLNDDQLRELKDKVAKGGKTKTRK